MGLIKDNIIPFFFDSSVTEDVYLNLLMRGVWPAIRALMGDEIVLVYFKQDGASAHYSKVARRWLDHTFKERWIGRARPTPWPARSSDLSPLDFWLWGYLRDQVYGQQLELRMAIQNAIQAIKSSGKFKDFSWAFIIKVTMYGVYLLYVHAYCKYHVML